MKMALVSGVVLMMAALSGCDRDTRTTCYGVEPDGEVEKLKPCPPGWKDKETKVIGEDEFWSYEVNEPGVNKKNRTTVTIKPSSR